MRILRRLGIIAVILTLFLIAGDSLAKNVAEERIGNAVQRELKLERPPKVRVSGFPVLLRALINGDVGVVEFDAENVTLQGLTMRRATARFESLHASDLLNGRRLNVTVKKGTLTAEATDEALTAYLKRRKVDVTLTLHDGEAVVRATRTILFKRRTIIARGTVTIDDVDEPVGTNPVIIFEPRTVSVDGRDVSGLLEREAKLRTAFNVPIPSLPGGVRAERIELLDGAARFTGSVTDQGLNFSA